MKLSVTVLVVPDPGPGGDRADAEPDETGWSEKHEGASVVVVVVVPIGVVVWHMMSEDGGARHCERNRVVL